MRRKTIVLMIQDLEDAIDTLSHNEFRRVNKEFYIEKFREFIRVLNAQMDIHSVYKITNTKTAKDALSEIDSTMLEFGALFPVICVLFNQLESEGAI